MRLLLATVAMLGPLTASPAVAQRPDTARRAPLCWKAKPSPACRSFLLTTVAIEVPFLATRRVHHHTYYSEASSLFPGVRLTGTAGWMVNSGSRAYGAAGVWSTGGEHARSGVELRARQWLPRGHVAEVGAGVALVTGDATPFSRIRGSGVSASAEYGMPNFLALTTRYELVRAGGEYHQGGFVGARIGSYGAPIAVAAGTVLLFAALVIAYGGGS